jgi:hypothetical protein
MNLPSKIRMCSKAWFAFYNKDRHPEIRKEVCDYSTIWALEIIEQEHHMACKKRCDVIQFPGRAIK